MLNREKLIVILGPTASGKTEMAIKLAKKFSAKGGSAVGWNGVEIVSADSRQIYRGMDIATAKPLKNQKSKIKNQNYKLKLKNNKLKLPFIVENIPHYLINIINPDEEFTLAQYKNLAVKIIKNIQKRKKIPFLVGGTGLYISSIVDNFEIPKVKPNKLIREKLAAESAENLFEKLKKIDPAAAEIIGPANKRKLIRALEVYLTTKKKFSLQQKRGERLFDFLQIGIKIPRQELYRRINKRVDEMLKKGLEKEVKNLIGRGYDLNLPSMSGLGYRQMIFYFKNEISRDEAIEMIKRDTRHYARRQMTWFKRDKRINWVEKYSEAEKLVKKFLISGGKL